MNDIDTPPFPDNFHNWSDDPEWTPEESKRHRAEQLELAHRFYSGKPELLHFLQELTLIVDTFGDFWLDVREKLTSYKQERNHFLDMVVEENGFKIAFLTRREIKLPELEVSSRQEENGIVNVVNLTSAVQLEEPLLSYLRESYDIIFAKYLA